MPVEMAVDMKHDMVVLSLTEAVGVRELLRSIRRALADPRFHPGTNVEKVAGSRIAIIVGKASTYGIIRMFLLRPGGCQKVADR